MSPDAVEPRTVWFVTRAIAPIHGYGGLERAGADVVAALRQAGQSVTVLTQPPRPGAAADAVGDAVFVPWRVGGPSAATMTIGYWDWCARVSQLLARRVGPGTVIHANGASAIVLRAGRQAGAGLLLNPHGMEEFSAQTLRSRLTALWMRRSVRAGARVADVIVSTDMRMTESVCDLLRVPRGRVAVVPNAVDVERIRALAERGAAEVAGEPVDLLGARIVTVGRLVPNKGYDIMPGVLARLGESGANRVIWWHVGDGPQRTDILAELAARGLAGQARLLGPRSDEFTQAAMRSASVFCQPSRYEGSSLTTIEALAQRRAVVATAVGGIPDKIRDGETGLLVAGTPDAVAAGVRRFLDDPRLASACGERGAQLVEARFSMRAAAERFRALYAAILTGRGLGALVS